MSPEDMFEGIATRIVLCTSHKLVVEVSINHVKQAINTFRAHGYTQIATHQPKLGDPNELWLVEGHLWPKPTLVR